MDQRGLCKASHEKKTYPFFFGKDPCLVNQGVCCRRRNHVCELQSDQDGGWLYFEICFFLIGVLHIVAAHFLSLHFPMPWLWLKV